MTDDIEALAGRMDALEEEQREAARSGGGNNGVLLARMDERVGRLIRWAEKADERDEKTAERLRIQGEQYTGCSAEQRTKWQGHDTEHARLNTASKARDGVAYALAIAAGFGNKIADLFS